MSDLRRDKHLAGFSMEAYFHLKWAGDPTFSAIVQDLTGQHRTDHAKASQDERLSVT